VSELAELFPDADFRFHLTLRRAEPVEFFRAQDASGQLLAERARWLGENPERYAALRPEGVPLLAEFSELCRDWSLWAGCPHPAGAGATFAQPSAPKERTRPTSITVLGTMLEPDFLLLSRDEAGVFRLRGGALCFPSGWALEEKLGHTLDFIHGVVPGLNAALGSPIQQFLTRLKSGGAFLRDNWGLAATDERNLHPARRVLPPALPVTLDRLWLRVEHQALFALPRTGGIVFGIRVALHRLDEVARDPAVAAGLVRALTSMPEALAAYKGLAVVRPELVRRLRGN
jgi:hypothetical protein